MTSFALKKDPARRVGTIHFHSILIHALMGIESVSIFWNGIHRTKNS